jgi:translocator protein
LTQVPSPFPLRLFYAVAPVALAGALGSWATLPNIPTWYTSLAKPAFNPPNWIFGPVWTLLYCSMALAFFRILSLPPTPGKRTATVIFLVQIVLNGLWSWAFFAAHSPLAGLIVILALLVAILATIKAFLALDRLAGWILCPYLAWTVFAAVLNFSIWRLN